MMKKKWQHIIRETTDNVQKFKEKMWWWCRWSECVLHRGSKVTFPIFGDHIFAIWQCMQKRNKWNLFRSLPGGNGDKCTLHFWNFCLEFSPIIHELPIYELLTTFNDIGMRFFLFIVFAARVFPFLLLPLSPVKKKKNEDTACVTFD